MKLLVRFEKFLYRVILINIMGNYTSNHTNEYELINKTDPIEDIRKEQERLKVKRKLDYIKNVFNYCCISNSIGVDVFTDTETLENVFIFKVYFSFGSQFFRVIGYFYTPYEAMAEFYNFGDRIIDKVKNNDIAEKYYGNNTFNFTKIIEEVKETWDNFE